MVRIERKFASFAACTHLFNGYHKVDALIGGKRIIIVVGVHWLNLSENCVCFILFKLFLQYNKEFCFQCEVRHSGIKELERCRIHASVIEIKFIGNLDGFQFTHTQCDGVIWNIVLDSDETVLEEHSSEIRDVTLIGDM